MIFRPRTAPHAETTIRLSQADVRAGRVTPHPVVMQAAGATVLPEDAAPAERAVVWAQSARAAAVAKLSADAALGRAVAHAAAQLGRAAFGAPGRAPDTYETLVAGTEFVLVFELVTWTKAGEVIAILALTDAPAAPPNETSLWQGPR